MIHRQIFPLAAVSAVRPIPTNNAVPLIQCQPSLSLISSETFTIIGLKSTMLTVPVAPPSLAAALQSTRLVNEDAPDSSTALSSGPSSTSSTMIFPPFWSLAISMDRCPMISFVGVCLPILSSGSQGRECHIATPLF